MSVNESRIWIRINDLAALTEPSRPWTRRSFSHLFLKGRDWLKSEFRHAGLAVSIDPAGNLIGRIAGRTEGLPPIVLGSHSDTVPNGGRFDGILGLVAGLEVVQSLNEGDISLEHPLEVIDFLAEEPSEFGISCVGSRAIAGVLDRTMLDAKAPDGETLQEGITRVGGSPDKLTSPLRSRGETAAYVELHIEQGPVLESLAIPIGIVTDIYGISRTKIHIEGQPDHAGTTPMNLRRDALVGAARIIEKAYGKALDMVKAQHQVVATIGHLSITPNAINAVPGDVELMLEVRSDSEAILRSFATELVDDTSPFCEQLRLKVAPVPVSYGRPTACSPAVQDAIETASARLGLKSRRMPSGAGHDAVFMEHTGPIGMIFVPSRNGRSHCPDEWTEPSDVAAGGRVLYETVLQLDRTLTKSSA